MSNKIIEKSKEVISLIWPDLLALAGSIIYSSFNEKNGWSILWAYSPFIVVCPIRIFYLIKKRKVLDESPNFTVSNEIRRIVHLVDQSAANVEKGKMDENQFKRQRVSNINTICEKVYNTMAGIGETMGTKGDRKEFCVIASLVEEAEADKDKKYIVPMFNDNMSMANEYMSIVYEKKLLMEQNTIYSRIYDNYLNSKKPTIITTSNIKQKIRDGEIRSSITSIRGIGLKKFPYNSSCVFPILPFHNPKEGTEMQGYVTILSKKRNAFGDNNLGTVEVCNTEFNSYLETLSGYYYKIFKY